MESNESMDRGIWGYG